MQLKNTTKMAFQAALAVFIAEVLSIYLEFDRGYWIVLTAMALTTQTWGESVKRAYERVGMTILGGSFGTLCYFFLPENYPVLMIVIMLIFVFFAIYMLRVNYLISVFALTCFVVFLFALIGDWDLLVLRDRVADTIIGAFIALGVGLTFMPLRTNVLDNLKGYLQKLKAALEIVFYNKKVRADISGQHLINDFYQIKKDALLLRYELFFHRLNSKKFDELLTFISNAKQYVANLMESYHWLMPHLRPEDQQMILTGAQTSFKNIDVLIQGLEGRKPIAMLPADDLEKLLEQAIRSDPERFATLDRSVLGFVNLMYFFMRLNFSLNQAYQVVSKF